jgi:VanZ family protein
MLAFSVLAILGANGYRSVGLPLLGERLSFLGALVEVCQSIPALHRDCDIRDWLVDTLAIIITLLIVRRFRDRRRTRARLNDRAER